MVIRLISDENTARNGMDSSLGEHNHCYFCWFWLPNIFLPSIWRWIKCSWDGNLPGFHNSLLSLEFLCSKMAHFCGFLGKNSPPWPRSRRGSSEAQRFFREVRGVPVVVAWLPKSLGIPMTTGCSTRVPT